MWLQRKRNHIEQAGPIRFAELSEGIFGIGEYVETMTHSEGGGGRIVGFRMNEHSRVVAVVHTDNGDVIETRSLGKIKQ
jgi:hypothetical protein